MHTFWLLCVEIVCFLLICLQCALLVLQGATAAASITIDWQALRFYLYFQAHSITNPLQGLRQYAGNSAPVRAVCTYYVRVLRYISSILGRIAHVAISAHSGSSSGSYEGATGDDTSEDDSTLIRERTETSARTSHVQQQLQPCSACQLSSPEVFILCNVCLLTVYVSTVYVSVYT